MNELQLPLLVVDCGVVQLGVPVHGANNKAVDEAIRGGGAPGLQDGDKVRVVVGIYPFFPRLSLPPLA